MALVKTYIEPSHEDQQYKATYDAAVSLNISPNVANMIATESVQSLHMNYEGARIVYIKQLKSNEERNKKIKESSEKTSVLMREHNLSKAHINRIKAK